jgi:GNAT superfamily N-acetyltransferase
VIVRPATAADTDAMARCHAASADAAYAHIVERDPGLTERRLRAWREVLAGKHRAHLAEADGNVVGVLNVSDDELQVIYVHPDWWGTGVGQRLLDQAHSLLAETCDTAVLTVLAGNARARRFYERNGWLLVSELVEPHFGGVPTAVCRYRRRFAEEVSDTESV